MKEMLSRVYLDDHPITLMGDEATPPLSRIIRAGGKHPNQVDVLYLTSPTDRRGRAVAAEEIIDRTAEPTRPIYLRTVPKDATRIFAEQAKPILTADAERVLSQPDLPSGLTSRAPMPNLDPVISQLGGAPRETSHEEAVFRSPSQLPPAAPLPDPLQQESPPVPGTMEADAASAVRAAALAKAARLLKAAAAKALRVKESDDQAAAEGEAEQRQEDERNNEDAIQDAEEAAREGNEDAERQA